MNLLHIDSSILGLSSASRELSSRAVTALVDRNPEATVIYRDLAANPLEHLSGRYVDAALGLGPDVRRSDPALEHDLTVGEAVMTEFLEADTVVIGVALYNFGIASQLKAWVDRIAVPGKTFRYTEHGVEGLATNKRVILTVARGGLYGAGSPTASFEHAESYLRAVFTFLGVADLQVIVAEGLRMGSEGRERGIAAAMADIAEL